MTKGELFMASIILAEDDVSMRHFLTAALEKAGHRVTPCDDGLSALAEIEKDDKEYDLLLADIVMPGMDGIELSQKATALRPALKVMFITGFAASILGEKPASTLNARVLSKPFHLSELVRQIDDILLV
jgi:two-component system cell cycle response regulator CpdR